MVWVNWCKCTMLFILVKMCVLQSPPTRVIKVKSCIFFSFFHFSFYQSLYRKNAFTSIHFSTILNKHKAIEERQKYIVIPFTFLAYQISILPLFPYLLPNKVSMDIFLLTPTLNSLFDPTDSFEQFKYILSKCC